MKKRIYILALMLSVMLGLGACGSAKNGQADATNDRKDLKKVTFVLDWTPNTNHTGLYVALEKGYFAKEGLDVEIQQPPEDGAEVLVASGKADFGVSFQDSMAAALAGEDALPITAVAAVIQHNTSGIISRAGEGMDTPKGMEGHSYATWNSPIELATLEQVMKADGGDFSKVKLIPSTVTDEVSALKTRSVDSIWVFYAWAGVKMELEGLKTDYFSFAEMDSVFDYYTPVVIANNDFLKEQEDVAKAFMKALSMGYEFAMEYPEEAADILCKAAPELDRELVVASQKYLADQYQAEAEVWGYIDAQRWNSFYQWINDNELVKDEVPLDTAFTNDYLSRR